MKVVNQEDICGLYRPSKDSHKGQNGRLLVIGGSKLFHSSIFWTADVASRIVDLVHFSSPAMENNDLLRKKAKERFWNGIVVSWDKIEDYIKEDDCIVIGPGMPRKEGLEKGERPTAEIVNGLFKKFPSKRWVVDGGALQEMDAKLLSKNMVITPHLGELRRLLGNAGWKISNFKFLISKQTQNSNKQVEKVSQLLCNFSNKHDKVTVLLKGRADIVAKGDKWEIVEGGNEGMTKGGTGDVLAGLVGALYCKNDGFLAAKAGSFFNKSAGDMLYKKVGPFFNASDLVGEVPRAMKEIIGY